MYTIFREINEHAIFVANYHIGVIGFTSLDLETLDYKIQKVLSLNRIHMS